MKNNKKERFIIFVLCLLLLMLSVFWGFHYWKSLNTSSPYETKVDAITQIDYTKRQEAINQVVADGMINIQYSMGAVFKGKVSQSFNVKNNINNHYPLAFEIYDENGISIYQSKLIEPGYEINKIELTKPLDKGVHDCTIKIGYANAGNVSSVFPITIEVK